MSISEARLSESSEDVIPAESFDHLQTVAPSAAERRGWVVALVAAAALHLVVPAGLFLYAGFFGPRPEPPVEEIPIEIVAEEPKPPEPKPEQPKPKPQPDDERPAYDAPSAPTPEKANRESTADKSHAPKVPAEAEAPGAPPKSEHEQATAKETAQTPPEPPKPPEESDQAAATPPAPKVAPVPSPKPAPAAVAPPGAPPPDAEEAPNYQFAHAATESPVMGGNADSRYFTIVFGMIHQRFRQPTAMPGKKRSGGTIVFALDEAGNLLGRKVVVQSGSPALDMAMMNAIAEAAPYPAPPDWQQKSMQLVYGRGP